MVWLEITTALVDVATIAVDIVDNSSWEEVSGLMDVVRLESTTALVDNATLIVCNVDRAS